MKVFAVYASAMLLAVVFAPAIALESSLNCSSGSCDDDEAPCPPDSAPELGPDGGPCVCVAKHCVQPRCRYGTQRVLQKRGTTTPGDCCDIYECVTPKEKNCSEVVCDEDVGCPVDSYRLPSHKAPSDCCSVAQGCQCLPSGACPVVSCSEGEHARVVRPGSSIPGRCCPIFECLKHDPNDTCMVDEKEMKNGSEWWKDACTQCTCNNGLVSCDYRDPKCPDIGESCPATKIPSGECCPVCTDDYPSDGILGGCPSASGKFRHNGEKWKDDPCTSCECAAGVKSCQAYMCEVNINCEMPKHVAGECCPLCDATTIVTLPPHCPGFNNCSLRCMHGFKRDDAGCYSCQCQAEQCLLECPSGYSQDVDGNKLCKCATPTSVAAADCPPLTGCRKNCSHGFRLSKAGCEICKCSQCRPITDCDKNCPHGFKTNDRACQICKCRATSEATPTDNSSHLAISHTSAEDSVCLSADGESHDAGEAWFDGCRQCYCHAGVEMCNLITCPVTQCKDPVFNSSTDCCPHCPESGTSLPRPEHRVMLCQSVDGAYRVEGETWALNECTQCLCHSGRVLCEAKQCPAAPCAHPVARPGQCCPHCPSAEETGSSESCSLERPHGSTWREGNCRSCTCLAGQVTCFEEECAPTKCDRPVLAKNWCCSVCLDHTEPKSCEVGNVTYHADEKWNEDACTHCVCQDGTKFCTEKVCSVSCSKPVKKPGKCCPTCTAESVSSHGFFDHSVYYFIIAILFILVGCMAIYIFRQRCLRRRQMVVNDTSYANYSTHTPPPQYASADRRDPYQYKYVQSYDSTQIDEMLKSPSIGATEKMALAPV